MAKILKFIQKKLKKKQNIEIKKTAHLLIDLCEGDFAIVFKTEDMKKYFDEVVDENFIVAMSDIEKRKIDNPEYFFSGFSGSRQYFDLGYWEE